MIWLHWLTLLLVIAAVGMVLARELAEDRALRLQLLDAHRQFGLLVFLLTAARLSLRILCGRHDNVQMHGLHRAIAAITHAVFYVLLVLLPLLGLLASQARGQAVHLLGLPLATWLARDRDLAEQLLAIHEWTAWTLLAMAGCHAVAALWHHWVRGDDTLRSMLPTSSR